MSDPKFQPRGLNILSFPRYVRWMMDEDYIPKLQQELRRCKNPARIKEIKEGLAWLAQYREERYGRTNLRAENAIHNTDEMRKELYNDDYHAKNDAYTISKCENKLLFDNTKVGQHTEADLNRVKPTHLRFEDRPPEPVKLIKGGRK